MRIAILGESKRTIDTSDLFIDSRTIDLNPTKLDIVYIEQLEELEQLERNNETLLLLKEGETINEFILNPKHLVCWNRPSYVKVNNKWELRLLPHKSKKNVKPERIRDCYFFPYISINNTEKEEKNYLYSQEELFLELKRLRETSNTPESKERAIQLYEEFLDRDINDTKINFFWNSPISYELGVISYYTEREDKISRGLFWCDKVRLLYHKNQRLKISALSNSQFYLRKLKTKREIPLKFPLKDGFSPLNPSILKLGENYHLICRTVNFDYAEGKYLPKDDDGIVKNINYHLILDKDYNLISYCVLKDLTDFSETVDSNLYFREIGFQDCRLFKHKDRFFFLANNRNLTRDTLPKLFLCEVDLEENTILWYSPIKGLKECEKNWLPFSYEDKLYVVHSYSPLKILELEIPKEKELLNRYFSKNEEGCPVEKNLGQKNWEEKGRERFSSTFFVTKPKNTISTQSLLDFGSFRGGSSPILFKEGEEPEFLVMLHEVIFFTPFTRKYFHRYLIFSYSKFWDRFYVTKISLPFKLSNGDIEFCSGGCVGKRENELLFTWGSQDEEAILGVMRKEDIDNMLIPISEYYKL